MATSDDRESDTGLELCIRFNFALAPANLSEAVRRMGAAIKSVQPTLNNRIS